MRVGDLALWSYEDGEPVVVRILGRLNGEILPDTAFVACEIVWVARRIKRPLATTKQLNERAQLPIRELKPVDPIWLGQMYSMTMDIINEIGREP